jgi:protein-S-isoprenylcysteine O-methyltransferase Ste14
MNSTTIGWLNFVSLLVFTVIYAVGYVFSVRPAHLEQKIGEKAYRRCTLYRLLLLIPMGIVTINYIVYLFYPVAIDPFPLRFSWPYWVNVLLAMVIGLPTLYVATRGVIDAGSESLIPEKKNTLYGGIYQKIRHPQAVGEAPMFVWVSLLLNSPFLVAFSLLIMPIWYWWSREEEKDLLLRYGDPYAEYLRHTGMFFPKRS